MQYYTDLFQAKKQNKKLRDTWNHDTGNREKYVYLHAPAKRW